MLRLDILRYLGTKSVPVTVENIFTALSLKGAHAVTVYRNVEAFERIRLVKRHYRKNGAAAFVLALSPDRLFIESGLGFEPAVVAPQTIAQLDRAITTLRSHVLSIGYQNAEALIQFFGSRSSSDCSGEPRRGSDMATISQ
jgi:hypothetical protein